MKWIVATIVVLAIVSFAKAHAQSQTDIMRFTNEMLQANRVFEVCRTIARDKDQANNCRIAYDRDKGIAVKEYIRATERNPAQWAPLPSYRLPTETRCNRLGQELICRTN